MKSSNYLNRSPFVIKMQTVIDPLCVCCVLAACDSPNGYSSPTSFPIPRVLHSQLDLRSSEIVDSLSRSQDLTNELSAPYEVPQFPIEQLEKKLLIQRQLSVR